MVIFTSNTLSYTHPIIPKTPYHLLLPPFTTSRLQPSETFFFFSSLRFSLVENEIKKEVKIQKFRWIEVGPKNITESQKKSLSQLPPKMTKRCKSLLKQLICFDYQDTENRLFWLLGFWVKVMKPKRADWLVVLKEMSRLQHPLLFQVTEFAFLEESFEAHIRDYTKIIDGYAKQNRLQDAENTFQAMKKRGFTCDQITLTVLIQMYSKAGNLSQAEETFEEIKLLALPLDKRAYGSMIMAYVRAGMPERGESLLREMEAQEINAGREVYKALLRAYSTLGDTLGTQRVFDAIQFAGISPDVRLCALLMNAYRVAGQSDGARCVLENLRRAGLEPSDKCVALMLAAYEKENKLNIALDLLIDLERDNVLVGKEASEVLVGWFRKLGVVDEVALVLSEYSSKEVKCRTTV